MRRFALVRHRVFIASVSIYLFADWLAPTRCCGDDIRHVLATVDDRIETIRKRDAVVQFILPDGSIPDGGASAAIQLTKHDFHFGCNFFAFGETRGVAEASYRERFRDVMNLAVLPFYWHTYEPQRGETMARRWLEAAHWCRNQGITTKGHPLVWNMEPPWVRNLTTDESERLLWGRISEEVGRFRGLVDMWDVINETTEGNKYARQRSATALLNVYQKYGIPRVTKKAFELARRANADATLVLNDFETTDRFLQAIRRAQEIETNIDAIGLQSHMHTGYWGAAKTWEVCERFGELGIPLHFTEITIVSGRLKRRRDQDWETKQADWRSTPQGEREQATQVRELYHLLFSHPSVEAIIWWDLTDKHAWMGAPGGLLRADMSPKPAYYVIRDLITKGWSTNLRAKVDANGQTRLRGFMGEYSAQVAYAGRNYEARFALQKDTQGVIRAQLR